VSVSLGRRAAPVDASSNIKKHLEAGFLSFHSISLKSETRNRDLYSFIRRYRMEDADPIAAEMAEHSADDLLASLTPE
jgi:hypothetical protein